MSEDILNYKFTLKVLNKYRETIVDGPGIRYSIYFSGCNHKCQDCHNKKSWDPNNGTLVTYELLDEMIEEINSNPLLDGITLSGGDPFYNPDDILIILKYLKQKTNKHILCYTGYTIEEILKDKKLSECLQYVDTLIDGPYIKEKKDHTKKFVGSSNQRIINIKNLELN